MDINDGLSITLHKIPFINGVTIKIEAESCSEAWKIATETHRVIIQNFYFNKLGNVGEVLLLKVTPLNLHENIITILIAERDSTGPKLYACFN